MAIEREIGCLLIEDPIINMGVMAQTARALSEGGARAGVFHWNRTQRLYPALQQAYQSIRSDGAVNALIAIGAGCDCAMALACQLPADRLVLLEPVDWQGRGDAAKQLKRIRAFARQNSAFCVADALVVPGPNTASSLLRRLARDLTGGRLTVLQPSEEMWTNRKEVLNLGIFRFLKDGVLPKCLAENPEMCIIYG